MRCAFAALCMLLGACTTIGHEKVEGWPALAIIEHYVPLAQMRDRCARYVGFGMIPEACAEFHFSRGECHIWLSADTRPSRAIVEHERLHCAGYDHVGAVTMRRFLERYQTGRTHSAALGGGY